MIIEQNAIEITGYAKRIIYLYSLSPYFLNEITPNTSHSFDLTIFTITKFIPIWEEITIKEIP